MLLSYPLLERATPLTICAGHFEHAGAVVRSAAVEVGASLALIPVLEELGG